MNTNDLQARPRDWEMLRESKKEKAGGEKIQE
jgi:hypothetical protein